MELSPGVGVEMGFRSGIGVAFGFGFVVGKYLELPAASMTV
jgi:hypothetical protein